MSFKSIYEVISKVVSKKYGDELITTLNGGALKGIKVIPTNIKNLDKVLGIGGFPRGRMVELYGAESSGKSSLCLHLIAQEQKINGGTCGVVDFEQAMDMNWAKKLGVNTDELIISQPDYGEQGLDIVESMIEHGCSIVVVDSIASIIPKAELEGDYTDASMASQARLMSKACRKLVALVRKNKVLLIFTNQTRAKLNVMFGNPNTTSGGNAMKFYASIRLELARISKAKEGDVTIRVKCVKNKVAPPYKETEIVLNSDTGFTQRRTFEEYLAEGFISKDKTGYHCGGVDLGVNKKNAKEAFKNVIIEEVADDTPNQNTDDGISEEEKAEIEAIRKAKKNAKNSNEAK